jgi:hypothetical protein
MAAIRKTRAVRVIVRPDRRQEYLERWKTYAKAAKAAGVRASLYEDHVLPGRFLEFTEHTVAKGMEAALRKAFQLAELKRSCVRREGDDVFYRQVEVLA